MSLSDQLSYVAKLVGFSIELLRGAGPAGLVGESDRLMVSRADALGYAGRGVYSVQQVELASAVETRSSPAGR